MTQPDQPQPRGQMIEIRDIPKTEAVRVYQTTVGVDDPGRVTGR